MSAQLKAVDQPQTPSGLIELLYPYPEGSAPSRPALDLEATENLLATPGLNLRPPHNSPVYSDSAEERACLIVCSRAELSVESLLRLATFKAAAEEMFIFRPRELLEYRALAEKVAQVLSIDVAQVEEKASIVLRGLSE